ncbi:MAG: 6-carboxytetrahydropterin synthase [Nitrospirae bacterium]|nr:6-carboxytetrahydropterin synthase [Nitrospirota bacterium]
MENFHVRIERGQAHFCSGHFLIFPNGRSEPIHGHNYRVEVEVAGKPGPGGLVVDFLKLMPIVQAVCRTLDNRTILPTRNRRLKVRRGTGRIEATIGRKRYELPASDVVLLPLENSSCELLAQHVGREIIKRLRSAVGVRRLHSLRVSIEEAPGEVASFTGRFAG